MSAYFVEKCNKVNSPLWSKLNICVCVLISFFFMDQSVTHYIYSTLFEIFVCMPRCMYTSHLVTVKYVKTLFGDHVVYINQWSEMKTQYLSDHFLLCSVGSRLLHPVDHLKSGQKVFFAATHPNMDRNRKWLPGTGAVLLILLSHMTSALEVPLDRKCCPYQYHRVFDIKFILYQLFWLMYILMESDLLELIMVTMVS